MFDKTSKLISCYPRQSIILAVCCYSAVFVVVKNLLSHTEPMLIAALRVAIPFCLVAPMFLTKKVQKTKNPRVLLVLILCTLFQFIMVPILTSYGLQQTSVINAEIILALLPAMSFLIGIICLKKPFSMIQFFWVSVSMLGIAIMFVSGMDLLNAPMLGDAMIMLATLAASTGFFLNSYLTKYMPPFSILCYMLLFGSICYVPLAWDNVSLMADLSIEAWGSFIFLGVGGGLLANYIFVSSLQHVSVLYLTICANLVPVFAIFWASLFLGESLTIFTFIACCLVVTAAIFIDWNKQNKLEDQSA